VNTFRSVAILGSTGSIGRSSLEVISRFPDRFRVAYLTGNHNIDLLCAQAERFRPAGVVVMDPRHVPALRARLPHSIEILSGTDGLMEVVARPDTDIVLSSLVGFAGLLPTLRAIESGKDIALANKETLVVGGEIVMRNVRERGIQLLPVDSEHSAILQCLQGENLQAVQRLILTASGGPFLHYSADRFLTITREEALQHPTWKMGKKITIDSATLMNKGLEVIEAHWLFALPPEKIDVVIHPQSIIHSMVEFLDGSIKAQLGVPDMKLPIQYALTYPERPAAPHQRLNFADLKQMTFYEPDLRKFRCLALAYEALRAGGTAPAVLNAANEVAVQLFLEERIPFSAIPELIEDALTAHTVVNTPALEEVVHADAETRRFVHHQTAVAP
jgi:1-deoxy-D-xylulose-5-phosphate reductoisomerase